MDVESAGKLIPGEIHDALKRLLKGDFREVRRYAPKRTEMTAQELNPDEPALHPDAQDADHDD